MGGQVLEYEAKTILNQGKAETKNEDIRSLADTAAERTRSSAVQVIGRKFVLYRPAKKPKIVLPGDR